MIIPMHILLQSEFNNYWNHKEVEKMFPKNYDKETVHGLKIG